MHQRFRVLRRLVSILAISATVVTPYAALVPVAHAATLFSDGFESGNFSLWTGSGPQWNANVTTAHSGVRKAIVRGNTGPVPDVLRKDIATTGYENIVLSYWYRADDLEATEGAAVQWFDGVNWNTLATITDGADDGVYHLNSHALPAGAANNASFAFRFGARMDAFNDSVRIDDVSLDGDLDTTAPVVEITSPVESEVTGPVGTIIYTVGDAASVSCVLDTVSVPCDLSGSYVFLLPDGSHTFEVTGVDAAGNDATDSVTWTVSTPATTGTVIVNKTVVGGSSSIATFQLFVGETLVESGASNEFASGSYQFSEINGNAEEETYEPSYGAGCPDGLITVVAGETTTCDVTNTYVTPEVVCDEGYHLEGDVCVEDEVVPTTATITVIKETVGGYGSFHFNGLTEGGFDLETTASGSDSQVFEVPVEGASDSFTITEVQGDGAWTLTDISCDYEGNEAGVEVGNSVTVYLDVGDEVTCTFTNTLPEGTPTPTPTPEPCGGIEQPACPTPTVEPEENGGGGHPHPKATLIVEKVILNSEDASVSFSDFSFWLEGELYQFEEDGSNEFTLRSGDYMVTEDYTSGYTVGYSGDCDKDGNLEMIGGEAYTCVVTNTLGVGGFNPGSEVPAPTPTPTPTPAPTGGSSGGSGANEGGAGAGTDDDTLGSTGDESPSPSASPSAGEENLVAAAIGSLADWPVCLPGGIGWIVVNLGLYLLAFLWLQRGDWKKALVALAIMAAALTWLAGECTNTPSWLPSALSVFSLLWIRLRSRGEN